MTAMGRQSAASDYSMLRPVGELAHKLLRWFDLARRAMPWRETRDPYAIWLSETMLQQTQVATVKPYWHRFLQKFPTVKDLASADLQEVLALWAGLGYYRRARHLHLAAKAMVEKHGGQVPRTVEELLSLPGVGRYTAGAVASIAFGVAAPVVDGNVMRVLSRLTGYDRDIADPKHVHYFWHTSEGVLRGGRPRNASSGGRLEARYGDINQSLMELGALVCTPLRPSCLMCPVREFCRAFAEGRQEALPVKRKKGETPVVRGVAVVLLRSRKPEARSQKEVLVMQRPAGGVWAEMWEFPVVEEGGRSQKPGARRGEEARWIGEALGLEVESVRRCGTVRHALTHRQFELEVVVCEAVDGARPRLPACVGAGKGECYAAARWVVWPLAVRGELPLARVVHKVAERVSESQRCVLDVKSGVGSVKRRV
jgi:A/G-specific adenine glycosylase